MLAFGRDEPFDGQEARPRLFPGEEPMHAVISARTAGSEKRPIRATEAEAAVMGSRFPLAYCERTRRFSAWAGAV